MEGNDADKVFNDWESGRVTQLIYYLQDCQQGIRDEHGHILSVIAVAVSMLTLFFGLSIFGKEIGKSVAHPNGRLFQFKHYGIAVLDRTTSIIEDVVTVRRLAFWFTSIIFLVAVLYMLILWIDMVLRYHYCQHLGDRLHSLIKGAKDDEGRNALVIYEQFSSPVKTVNINHLTNSHNLMNLTAHYIAGGLAFAFSIGAIITQFALLEVHVWYDWFILILIGTVLITSVILFIRFNLRADEIVDMAFIVAHQNLDVRKGIVQGELYRNAKHFLKALLYLIFPRTHVFHKDALIIAGFIAVSMQQRDFYPMRLIFVLLIYSFLLCQARYQFNDLRGLKEDLSLNRTDRLYAGGNVSLEYLTNVSMIICLLRITFAVILIAFLGRGLKKEIFICGAWLIVLTILYEISRSVNSWFFTILFSGAGYPLRVYVGAIAAEKLIVKDIPLSHKIILFIIFSLWGVLGCIMEWTKEVEQLIYDDKMSDGKHPKSHYEKIYAYLNPKIKKERTPDQPDERKKTSILLNQYNYFNYYNVFLWVILFFIGIEFYMQKSVAFLHPIYDPVLLSMIQFHLQLISMARITMEIVLILLCSLTSLCKKAGEMIVAFISSMVWGFTACYAVYSKTTCFLQYSLLTILTLAVTASVLFIRLVPKTTLRNVSKDTLYYSKRLIFGKYAANKSCGREVE